MDDSIGRSVEKGALGWECWDGSMGMGAWGKENENESMWMGAWGIVHGNYQLVDGSVMMCRGGLDLFSIILNFFSPFILFFLLASLKKFTEKE